MNVELPIGAATVRKRRPATKPAYRSRGRDRIGCPLPYGRGSERRLPAPLFHRYAGSLLMLPGHAIDVLVDQATQSLPKLHPRSPEVILGSFRPAGPKHV